MLPELDVYVEFYHSINMPMLRETGAAAAVFTMAQVFDDVTIDILSELEMMRLKKDKEDRDARERGHG